MREIVLQSISLSLAVPMSEYIAPRARRRNRHRRRDNFFALEN
jgi:hypothetical protein